MQLRQQAKVGAIAGRYQFAVFADSNGVPGSKLADTGEVTATTTGWQVYPLSAPLPEIGALMISPRPVAPVFVDGEKTVTLKGARIAEEFQAIVARYVAENYAPGAQRRRSRAIRVKAV